ncbi:GNAT family N-acetyltransferase [Tabrizicola oligotrophica]|uniref:GNAT family N-acetyltransferase n=1 Tax=Tabrizicola oligotrophica TaxID=2710650 RepID=A0A6M0QSJ6_9RHOB|nr:GNAT family N-acetyltransferase [Tabrizicola oligotrophica]NEY89603.1 GNAT family N-acetyltransferase [Tabrizicola oligotrophica]
MTPTRVTPPYDWGSLLALIRAEFAYMDGMIDPPSSMHRLTEAEIARQAEDGEVWAIGTPAVACMFLTVKGDWLYLGKLAVAADQRGKGLARDLVDLALSRARTLGLAGVELQTRIELTTNHATFRALGFTETGRSAHPGYDRPTTLTFRRALAAA